MSEKRNRCDDEIKQLELQEHEECVFRGVDFADRRRERFDDRRVIDKHDARLRQFGGHLRDLFGSGLARQKVEREDPRVLASFALTASSELATSSGMNESAMKSSMAGALEPLWFNI